MKTTKHNLYLLLTVLSILPFFLTSCYDRIEPEFNYTDFRRVIGPEGGVINFYEYNPNDSIPNVILKMEFPQNALDSFIVFNMYEFYDPQTDDDLEHMNIEDASKFLYFIQIYESDGYNNEDTSLQDDAPNHLSINFNLPVKITYKIREYGEQPAAKLYRIPIPKKDDPTWNHNILLSWNNQGYTNGYDELDLIYLITGRWIQSVPYGDGTPSLANWVETPYESYTYNANDMTSTVTFYINNTDSIYVMGSQTVK